MFGLLAGKRPKYLGVKEGKLAKCSSKPNSVSSQADTPYHKIDPIPFSGSANEAIAKIAGAVKDFGRTEIVQQDSNYLYAEFTSGLMGYVDDVEFYADEAAKVVHLRSSSRLGYSDMGANRKRIEAIRSTLGSI